MSRENVEIARQAYESFASGDIEAGLEFMDPDIECHDFAEMPDSAVYRGHEGFIALYNNVADLFDEFRAEPTEFIDAGDQVLVFAHTVGRGKGSGVVVEADLAHLWTVRNGKAVELRLIANRGEALRAAGVRIP